MLYLSIQNNITNSMNLKKKIKHSMIIRSLGKTNKNQSNT